MMRRALFVTAALCALASGAAAGPIPSYPAATTPLTGAEQLICAQGGVTKICLTGQAGGGGPPAANNAALQALAHNAAMSVVRQGFAAAGDSPPLTYTPSASACSLNSGAGDGGSQVPTSDSGCWIASLPTVLDARWWGQTYPATLYVDGTAGSDQGGANYCLQSTHKCATIQQALNVWMSLNPKAQFANISVAAGTYDSSNFAAGALPGSGSTAITFGAALNITGAGSALTIVNPTVGGGGCAQHFGDAFTFSNQITVIVSGMKIGTGCTGRSDLFLQNGAYFALGTDVQWATAPVDMIHVEANAIFEVPQASPFTIAAGATAVDALDFGTGAQILIDGGQINFNGNATFTDFVIGGQGGAMSWLAGTTVNLNGHTVTGAKYSLTAASVFNNESVATIPGNAAGVATAGAIYVDGSGTPSPLNFPVQGNILGSNAGSSSLPSCANANIVFYCASASNYAGVFADAAGDIGFVAGITGTPSTRFMIEPDGSLIAPTSVTGGGKGSGTLNIGGPYYEGGVAGVSCAANSVSLTTLVVTGGIVTHC